MAGIYHFLNPFRNRLLEIKDLDLIVIGGGPSGSLTAYYAAQYGFRVLILEKKRFPRVKPCGGGLTLRSLLYLPFSIDHLVKHLDRYAYFSVNRGKCIKCVAPNFFSVQIIRSEFDTYLLEQAQKAGAHLKTEEVVGISINDYFMVTTKHHTYKSHFLIAADGSNGITQKLFKSEGEMDDRVGVALEGDICLSDCIETLKPIDVEFHFLAYHSSYAWIFPKNKRGDVVNVGVFSYNRRKIKLSRQALYDFVKDRLSLKSESIENIRGYPLNFNYDIPSPHPRLIYVGDAAGFPEPLWGEGLHHAFKSAYFAGLSLKKLKKAHPEKEKKGNLREIYSHYCKGITTDLRFCHFLAEKFHRNHSLGRLFTQVPFLKKIFVKVMISGRPTYHILSRFFTLPFWSPSRQNAVNDKL